MSEVENKKKQGLFVIKKKYQNLRCCLHFRLSVLKNIPKENNLNLKSLESQF